MKFLLVLFSILGSFAEAQQLKVRGLRVDPGYFYNLYAGMSAAQASALVASQAQAAGVNTLFIYAYNNVYGAYYPTTYNMTAVEAGYGQLNIFKELTLAAKKLNLKVVAVVPVNNFKQVWDNKSAWRAKGKTGADYIPAADTYLLSAWHPEFKNWLDGFYKDLLSRNPGIDGVESVEPFVDYHWAKESDYNTLANSQFKTAYPKARIGDANWLKFRAQGLTNLISILNNNAHLYGKEAYLVQTWPADTNGNLFSADVLRDNIGLDVNTILNLTGAAKLNYFMAELMWQQWAAEYGSAVFTPTWTRKAATDFAAIVNGRSVPLVHVEISPFAGSVSIVTPTLNEFSAALQAARDTGLGMDVYDQNQIQVQNAWNALLSWN